MNVALGTTVNRKVLGFPSTGTTCGKYVVSPSNCWGSAACTLRIASAQSATLTFRGSSGGGWASATQGLATASTALTNTIPPERIVTLLETVDANSMREGHF